MQYIDIFAGCGGLSLGLYNAGLHGIFAIEKVIKKDRTPYIMIVCGAIILTAAFAAVIAVKRRRGKKRRSEA